jgi:gluconate 5-dehydrogenase
MSASNIFNLEGKIALVTGGSRGLGLQMAAGLGELGAKVVITARKSDELAGAEAELLKAGVQAVPLASDLSKLGEIPALVDTVIAQCGGVDILVNNAGTTWGALAEEYPQEAWDKVMQLNVGAVFRLTQEIARRCMIPHKQGKIINIASTSGLIGNPEGMTTIAYNTSKGALLSFTRALATEWGKHNINVNAICPGFFPTKMSSGTLGKIGDAIIARTPLQRLGGSEDLKGAVIFLASEASRHVTGQYLAVDGGACIA